MRIDQFLRCGYLLAGKCWAAAGSRRSIVHIPSSLLIWESECIRSLVSITVLLARPSPFVRKSKSRPKKPPPYHCQVMTLFEESSSLVKRDIWRVRWFIGYFYGVTKTWKDQAVSIRKRHDAACYIYKSRMHQFLFFSCLFLLLKGHIDLCILVCVCYVSLRPIHKKTWEEPTKLQGELLNNKQLLELPAYKARVVCSQWIFEQIIKAQSMQPAILKKNPTVLDIALYV